MACCFLLQGLFLAQGWNACLLHWQVDSSPLSHQGSTYSVLLAVDLGKFCLLKAFCLFFFHFYLFLVFILKNISIFILGIGKSGLWRERKVEIIKKKVEAAILDTDGWTLQVKRRALLTQSGPHLVQGELRGHQGRAESRRMGRCPRIEGEDQSQA